MPKTWNLSSNEGIFTSQLFITLYRSFINKDVGRRITRFSSSLFLINLYFNLFLLAWKISKLPSPPKLFSSILVRLFQSKYNSFNFFNSEKPYSGIFKIWFPCKYKASQESVGVNFARLAHLLLNHTFLIPVNGGFSPVISTMLFTTLIRYGRAVCGSRKKAQKISRKNHFNQMWGDLCLLRQDNHTCTKSAILGCFLWFLVIFELIL